MEKYQSVDAWTFMTTRYGFIPAMLRKNTLKSGIILQIQHWPDKEGELILMAAFHAESEII